MLVTGEASGDMHGARLAAALRRRLGDVELFGMGGPMMREAGVEILFPAEEVAVVGLVEVLRRLPAIRRGFARMRQALAARRPDVLVCIDLPDFNMRLLPHAARANVPVCYYICPQVWAWRPNRARRLAELGTRLAVILPFEEAFYRRYGAPATYVGHPLLDDEELANALRPGAETTGLQEREEAGAAASSNAPPDAPPVGLLPGSRPSEIQRILPLFLATARKLRHQIPTVHFLLVQAPGLPRSTLDQAGLAQAGDLPISIVAHDRYQAMRSCRAVLAASGTVTLELALLNVPTVVAYRTHPLTYAIGRRLVSVSHISLVNLIANRTVVPELLQDNATPEILADHLRALLATGPERKRQLRGFQEVRRLLGAPGASQRVSRIVLDILQGT